MIPPEAGCWAANSQLLLSLEPLSHESSNPEYGLYVEVKDFHADIRALEVTFMHEDRQRWNERYEGRSDPGGVSGIVKQFAGLARVGKALDVAAGQGRNAFYLARKGFRVEAVDISETALSHMSRKSENLYPVCADLDHFDIHRDRYDLIVNIRFLSRRLFPQILEGLCPGGVLIFEALLAAGEPEKGSSHPEYRLQNNELLHAFSPLRIVHYRETVSAGEGETPTASLVGILESA